MFLWGGPPLGGREQLLLLVVWRLVVLLVFHPALSDGVVGTRYARDVGGYADRANVHCRQGVRISDHAASFVSIIRLSNYRVLQGISCRVGLFAVRRFRDLQVSFFAQPVGVDALGAIFNGHFIHATHDGRLVSFVCRRANYICRVNFLFRYAYEGRSVLLQGTVACKGRYFRCDTKDVRACAASFANKDRVCPRRQINFLRAIRKRLKDLSSGVIRFGGVLFQFFSERTGRCFHYRFSGICLRCLTSGQRETTNARITFSRLSVVVFYRVLSVRQAKGIRDLNGLATSALSTTGHLRVWLLQQRLGNHVAKIRANGLSILASDVHCSFSVLDRNVRFRFLNVLGGLACCCQVFLQCVNYRFRRAFRFFLVKTGVRHNAQGRVEQASGCEGASLIGGFVSVVREDRFAPAQLICAGAIRRNERFLTVLDIIGTFNAYARGVSVLYVRTRYRVVQGLSANECGSTV